MQQSKAMEEAALDAMRNAAVSEKLTAEELEKRVAEAQQEAREKGLAQPQLRVRVWHVIKTTHSKLATVLNTIEGEGWQLVNILQNGIDGATVVCARIETLLLPSPEEQMEDQPTEPAPPLDENEQAREQWATETGGTQGEASAEVVEQGDATPIT